MTELARVIPHVGESIRDGFPYILRGEDATTYWVGITPRLAIRDGDGGYLRVLGGSNRSIAAAHLPPFTFDPTKGMRINAQVRFTGSWSGTVITLGVQSGTVIADFGSAFNSVFDLAEGDWHITGVDITPSEAASILEYAEAGDLIVHASSIGLSGSDFGWDVSWLELRVAGGPVPGILAIDTHDHPFHVVGTRDPAMPYELVIDTGTERVVEIVAGEEHLATHELVVDETGRPGTPWSHAGLFRPI